MPYKRHDIAEIEGVGKSRAGVLRQLGIRSTEDLLIRPESYLRAVAGRVPRFPVKRLAEFRAHAELMQVEGLTYQHAEALYRAGYRTLARFAAPDPATVVRALDAAVAENLIPESADQKTVLRWQKRALEIAYTGTLAGTITDGDAPVAGATVVCGFEQSETDERGDFYLPFVPAGRHRVIIRAEGFKRSAHRVVVEPGRSPRYRFKLERGADEAEVIDESQGQMISRFSADDKLVFDNRKLSELPEGTPLHFRERYKRGDKVRLQGVYRRREGNRVIVTRVVVPGGLVEKSAAPGDVYHVAAGALRKGRKRLDALRKGLLLDRFKAHGVKPKLTSRKGVAR